MTSVRRLAALLVATALLAPASSVVARDWDRYGPRERSEAMRNYEEHRRLPPERRREVERQYQRWQGMPEDERKRARENYERLQQLSPEQRREFDQKFERWQRERRK